MRKFIESPAENPAIHCGEDVNEIRNVPVKPQLQELDALHKGEAAAISLAHGLNLPLLIEEHKGRRIARLNQVTITSNAGVVLYAYQHGICTKQETTDRLDAKLKSNNISRSVYDTVLKQLEQ